MATIHDLTTKDMSSMTDEELQTHLLAIRGRRRNPDPEMKEQAKAKAIKKKNNAAALQDVSKMLQGVTQSRRQKYWHNCSGRNEKVI